MKDKDEYMKKDDSTLIGETVKYIPKLKKKALATITLVSFCC